MKTPQQRGEARTTLSVATLMTVALIIVFGQAQNAAAQTWNLTGNDISSANSGNVGIGTATPATKLHVFTTGHIPYTDIRGLPASLGGNFFEHTLSTTGFNNPFRAMVIKTKVDLTTNVTANVLGLYSEIGIPSTNSSALTSLTVRAGNHTAIYAGTGSLGDLQGFFGTVIRDGSGPVTTATGLQAVLINNNPNNAITTAYGLRIAGLTNPTGTITNTYGVHVGDMSEGTQTNTPFSFYASDANAYNYFAGNTGIGTTTPVSLLHLKASSGLTTLGDSRFLMLQDATGANNDRQEIGFGKGGGAYQPVVIGHKITNAAGSTSGSFYIATRSATTDTAPTEVVTVLDSGNVGIETPAPAYKLDVAGQIHSSTGGFVFPNGSVQTIAAVSSGGTITGVTAGTGLTGGGTSGAVTLAIGTVPAANVSAGQFASGNFTFPANVTVAGNMTVTGTLNAKYQDVAEWVPSSSAISAGTVVVLDPARSNHVMASSQAYDTRVAGVISARPGLTLGEGGENKVLVATNGRVGVKVDATRAPIHIGDLLVTSDIPGVAMKSEPLNLGGVQLHRPGTLIGKALEPLATGQGDILVLLSLQ